jgi:hypothetical protein
MATVNGFWPGPGNRESGARQIPCRWALTEPCRPSEVARLGSLWGALWRTWHGELVCTGVQPTNNHAERSLRGAVIYRKLSHGSQSEDGETRTARLLSHTRPAASNSDRCFVYLTEALNANARGHPAPFLS